MGDMMETIQVTKDNLETALHFFNKTTDEEGYIIDKDSRERVICPYSKEPIHKDSFSIFPEGNTFINNKSYCFAEHRAKHGRVEVIE